MKPFFSYFTIFFAQNGLYYKVHIQTWCTKKKLGLLEKKSKFFFWQVQIEKVNQSKILVSKCALLLPMWSDFLSIKSISPLHVRRLLKSIIKNCHREVFVLLEGYFVLLVGVFSAFNIFKSSNLCFCYATKYSAKAVWKSSCWVMISTHIQKFFGNLLIPHTQDFIKTNSFQMLFYK